MELKPVLVYMITMDNGTIRLSQSAWWLGREETVVVRATAKKKTKVSWRQKHCAGATVPA